MSLVETPSLVTLQDQTLYRASQSDNHTKLNTASRKPAYGVYFDAFIVEPYIVKIAHENPSIDTAALLMREAKVLRLIHESAAISILPTVIPKLEDVWDGDTPCAIYHLVPGQILTRQDIWDQFSVAEYESVGDKIGEFIAKLSRLISPAAFKQHLDEPTSSLQVPNRETEFIRLAAKHHYLDDLGHHNLAKVLRELAEERIALHKSGRLTPTIIGHDDLHPGNLTFIKSADSHNGPWRLHGIFDFADTKPSSPERELRFISQFHPRALASAVAAWENLTGRTIQMDLVWFWSRLHAVVSCASSLEQGRPISAPHYVNIKRCYPSYDWRAEF